MRSCSDVHNFLLEEGVSHEIVKLPALSTTAKKAAGLLGVGLHEVVKSLVFATDAGPVVALVPGDQQVDARLLRIALGCSLANLATPAEVLGLTGYRPGAMPPCGFGRELPVVADPRVFESAVVYCSGGTTTTMLKIHSEDLRAVIAPRVAPIAQGPENGATPGRAAGRSGAPRHSSA